MNIDDRFILFLESLEEFGETSYFSGSLTPYGRVLPPSIIPLNDVSCIALNKHVLVKHWFVERDLNFTTVSGEDFKSYSETARYYETFIAKFFLDWLTIEDEISDKMQKFSDALAFEKLKEVYDFFDIYGDNPTKMKKLSSFSNITPIEYIDTLDNYTGSFASSTNGILNVDALSKSTSFEIDDSVKTMLNKLETIPEWLQENANQKYLFDKYLEKSELNKAWLTLNSHGWKLKDVADALEVLEVLASKTVENGFDLLIENWLKNWKESTLYHDNIGY